MVSINVADGMVIQDSEIGKAANMLPPVPRSKCGVFLEPAQVHLPPQQSVLPDKIPPLKHLRCAYTQDRSKSMITQEIWGE